MVGQFEYSLMPWRTDGSDSTSMPLNFTPSWVRICTTAAEKPHCGKTGVPFMKSTTGWSVMSCLMRSMTVASAMARSSDSILWRARLQGQRVKLVAHAALERLVDHLVLLHAVLALEGGGDHLRGVMVAVAAQILDRDARVGQAFLDQPFDRVRVDRHSASGRRG